MSKKVFIGVGHGGSDPGAVKYVKEADANLQMALGLKAELERHGVKVGISRVKDENDPLSEEIKEANAFAPDLAVECHNNAGGGDGFEVYRQTNGYAAQSLKLAQAIEKRVKESGQKSRGVKTKLNSAGTDYFGWCRQVKAPAVLCEGFFVDNQADSGDYNTAAKQQALARRTRGGCWTIWGITIKPQAGAQPHKPTAGKNLPYSVRWEPTPARQRQRTKNESFRAGVFLLYGKERESKYCVRREICDGSRSTKNRRQS